MLSRRGTVGLLAVSKHGFLYVSIENREIKQSGSVAHLNQINRGLFSLGLVLHRFPSMKGDLIPLLTSLALTAIDHGVDGACLLFGSGVLLSCCGCAGGSCYTSDFFVQGDG